MSRKFNIQTTQYSQALEVQTDGCNAIIFTNLSDSTIYIDNVPVPPYAAGMQEYPKLCYYGLEGEIMMGTFNLKFGTSTAPLVAVTRKFY